MSQKPLPPTGWQYYAGWVCFALCFLLPVFAPLIPLLGFSKTMNSILIGALLVGGPEVFMIIAIALWGKSTFHYFAGCLKQTLWRYLKPAHSVSVARYYFGLILLLSSFIPCWIFAYIPTIVSNTTRIGIVLLFDILFIISFFILGGEFWEKIRALFTPEPIQIIKKATKNGQD